MLRVTENESGRGKTNDESALDRLAREGAQRMLAEALEAEGDAHTQRHRKARDQRGHPPGGRNGRAPTRRGAGGGGARPPAAPPAHDPRAGPGAPAKDSNP